MRPSDAQVTAALRCIHDSVRDRGFPPTRAEVAAACGWTSKSQGTVLLDMLIERGLVTAVPNVARGIQITQAGMIALTEEV